MLKKYKKIISAFLTLLIVVAAIFAVPFSTYAASDNMYVDIINAQTSYNIGGYDIIRNGFKCYSTGQTLYCINPPANPMRGNYTKQGEISSYNMNLASELSTKPTADFVRSLLYWANKLFGNGTEDKRVNMAVQLAIHKYPVTDWMKREARVPFNRYADNPIAEIDNNCGGYSEKAWVLAVSNALTYLAWDRPANTENASVSLNKVGGGYIDGENYIVAVYNATGEFDTDRLWFETEGTNIHMSKNGTTCTLYYPLSEVPETYEVKLKAHAVREVTAAYWYKMGNYQELALAESWDNWAEASVPFASGDVGGISLYKKDADTDTLLAGAQFKITNQNSGATYYKMTNASGVTEIHNLPYGLYTIEEITAPGGYYIGKNENGDRNIWTDVAITETSSNITLTAYNLHQSGKIKINKQDNQTGGIPQGDAVLTGAVFEIRDENRNLVETLTLTNTTTATSGKLPLGKYYIKETTAPVGYTLDENEYECVLSGSNQEVLIDLKEVTFKNEVIKGRIKIHKEGEKLNEFEKQYISLKDVSFGIYKNSELIERIVTDDDGDAISGLLPYGTYTVKELAAPDGYKTADSFEVNINETKEYRFNIKNDTYSSKVIIEKRDSTTNNLITKTGAQFKIYREDNSTVKYNDNDIFTTENGKIILPQRLTYGRYKIVEITAPDGYLKDTTPIEINITKESPDVITVVKSNKPVAGIIKINKTGNVFSRLEISESNYGNISTPIFENKGISGVEFEIYADEDIFTGDNTLRFTLGEKVDTVTTENGVAQSRSLYPGKYIIKETKTLPGYKIDETEYPVTVENAGESELTVKNISFNNNKSKTSVTLIKEAEIWDVKENTQDNTITRVVTKIRGTGFTFGLYAAETILTYNGEMNINENDLIAIAVSDENGIVKFDVDVPFAKYYIKEIDVPDSRYVLSDEQYGIDLTTEKTDGSDVVINIAEPIVNSFVRKEVKITKKDITTGNPLPGALIEISDINGNVVYRDYTGEDGTVPYVLLEPGKYSFKEIIAPKGYALNTEIISFEVLADGSIVGTTEMADDYTRYTVIKTDKDKNPLSDVIFGLYDENGNLIQERKTDETGKAEFVGFGEGEFYIKEIKAADGYIKEDNIITIIKNDGKYVNDETLNSVMVINSKIPKTGDNNNLAFWVLTLTAAIGAAVCIRKKKCK